MDFFERQAQARRRSGWLVAGFVVAVVLILVGVNAVAFAAAVWTGYIEADLGEWFATGVAKFVTLSIVLIVGMSSLFRHFDLRSGGDAVARLLGAREVAGNTRERRERRLMNVVDEMSIASGTPAPTVWLLEREAGINAMVAGYRPGEAALIVTRGALDTLDRSQLQGVVAHEFSHILNGDMRLNVRLMALLAGVLSIGIAGRGLVHGVARFGGSTRYSRSRDSALGGGALALAALGVGMALVVIGYVGTLVGRVLKASVSRQREFLADASAVQFTRATQGIAGALLAIHEHATGANVANPRVEEAAHMLFGDGIGLAGLFATHPPLLERINAIDPRFLVDEGSRRERSEAASADAGTMASVGGAGASLLGLGVAAVAMSAGRYSQAHVDYAHDVSSRWPAELDAAVHLPRNAVFVVYALLIAEMRADTRTAGLESLEHAAGREARAAVERLLPAVEASSAAERLPLLETCLPALRKLHLVHRDRLLDTAETLVAADGEHTAFEFALLALARHHLATDGATARVRHTRLEPVIGQVAAVLTCVARAGARNRDEVQAAFDAGVRTLGVGRLLQVGPGLSALPSHLETLSGLSPLLKRPLLEACAAAVLHDGKVTVREGELLRAIAATLDCPMPPMLQLLREVPASGR